MLTPADQSALDAQMRQFRDEMESYGPKAPNYEYFLLWRIAVALEEQAAALWSDDSEDAEPPNPWER